MADDKTEKTMDYTCTVDGLTLATGRLTPERKPEVVRLGFSDTVTINRATRHLIAQHVEQGTLVRADRFNGRKRTARQLWQAAKDADDSVANLTSEALNVPVDGSIPSISEFIRANPNAEGGVDTGRSGGDVAAPGGE